MPKPTINVERVRKEKKSWRRKKKSERGTDEVEKYHHSVYPTASHWSFSGLLSGGSAMKHRVQWIIFHIFHINGIWAQVGWVCSFVASLHNFVSVATLRSCAILWWEASAMGQGLWGPLMGHDPC